MLAVGAYAPIQRADPCNMYTNKFYPELWQPVNRNKTHWKVTLKKIQWRLNIKNNLLHIWFFRVKQWQMHSSHLCLTEGHICMIRLRSDARLFTSLFRTATTQSRVLLVVCRSFIILSPSNPLTSSYRALLLNRFSHIYVQWLLIMVI